ncbi:hypothetical protein GGX14DRAFT_631286, partial [Mycena pura]
MPVPLWTGNKAEARYNVTTECNLGLHSAAATGNVGLVEYALARGQPINSVLDGVLPLHAAAAGGNERVVKLLIEHGADVNATRLPRRYSNDKGRDTSGLIVGASESTPLHFAAANGHTNIVRTLLLHGAHANRADKHGVTAEMLARQHGHDGCAEELRTWIFNKDRDLREREGPGQTDEPNGEPLHRFTSRDRVASLEGETSTRRRIHMKRSVDTALSMFKGSSSGSMEALKPPVPSSSANLSANTSTLTPPPSPMKPFGEYTFYPNSESPSPIDPGSRRPSLPQISYPSAPAVHRKTSLASRGNPRRPRSAGNGAEPESLPSGRGGAGRMLSSKYSLLNMFKKGQIDGTGSGTQPNTSTTGIPSASALSSASSVALSQPSAESSSGPSSVNLTETTPYARRSQNKSPSMHAQQLPETQDEYAYGRPLPNSRLGVISNSSRAIPVPDSRPRGLSFTSSSQSSLSPANSSRDVDRPIPTEFPFSIHEPPPMPPTSSPDIRGRGASVSSTSTTESQMNPQLSASETTSGSGSVTVTTPLLATEALVASPQSSPMPLQRQLDGDDVLQVDLERGTKAASPRLNERRTHTPLDIDLSLISSHAQAEALVQKELQDILDMPVVSTDSKTPGWTPLSARLAAYGESLELERKFRSGATPNAASPVDEGTPTNTQLHPRTATSSRGDLSAQPRRKGIDRQASLDVKHPRRREKEPKRPSTSSGTDSPSTECTYSP